MSLLGFFFTKIVSFYDVCAKKYIQEIPDNI